MSRPNLFDAKRRPGGQRDRLFHNNRDGTFTEVTDSAGIAGETQGHSATWWDYDEDGWPDLYVANDFAPPDQLYHNNRDGTFTNVLSNVVPHTPHFSMGSDLGDRETMTVILTCSSPTWRPPRVTRTIGAWRHSGAPCRRTSSIPRPHPSTCAVRFSWATAPGACSRLRTWPDCRRPDWTFGVRLEDLDLDGRLDAYFTNGMAREFQQLRPSCNDPCPPRT